MEQRYEHAIDEVGFIHQVDCIARRQAEGWELCAVVGDLTHTLYWKRPFQSPLPSPTAAPQDPAVR